MFVSGYRHASTGSESGIEKNLLDEHQFHGVIDMISDGVVFEKEMKVFFAIRIKTDERWLRKRMITQAIKARFEFALITAT